VRQDGSRGRQGHPAAARTQAARQSGGGKHRNKSNTTAAAATAAAAAAPAAAPPAPHLSHVLPWRWRECMSVSLPTLAMCHRTLQGERERRRAVEIGAPQSSILPFAFRAPLFSAAKHSPPALLRNHVAGAAAQLPTCHASRQHKSRHSSCSPLPLLHDHVAGIAEEEAVDGVLQVALRQTRVGYPHLQGGAVVQVLLQEGRAALVQDLRLARSRVRV